MSIRQANDDLLLFFLYYFFKGNLIEVMSVSPVLIPHGMTLVIKHLSKSYSKEKQGLNDCSITIEPGILGLLGPNGAGKSTLMKIIATISKPTKGTLFLDGQDIVENPDYIR